MKMIWGLIALSLVATVASASPTFEKLVPGDVSVWNLKNVKDGIGTTLYVTGEAAKELYANLSADESGLCDEYGHPTGAAMKAGKNLVCVKDDYAQYRCSLNLDGRTGAVGK